MNRHLPSLLGLLLLGLALVDCGVFHKVYRASATIQVRHGGGFSNMLSPPSSANTETVAERIQKEIDGIASPDVLAAVIKDQKLDQIWAQRFNQSKDVMSPEEALSHFHDILKVEVITGTNIYTITAQSEIPQEAANIANGIANQYKKIRDKDQADPMRRDIESISAQIDKQKLIVDESSAHMEKLRQQISEMDTIVSPSNPPDHTSEADQFHTAQTDLEKQRSILTALIDHRSKTQVDLALMESPVTIVYYAVPPPK